MIFCLVRLGEKDFWDEGQIVHGAWLSLLSMRIDAKPLPAARGPNVQATGGFLRSEFWILERACCYGPIT